MNKEKKHVFWVVNKDEVKFLMLEFDLWNTLPRYLIGELKIPFILYQSEDGSWRHQGIVNSDGDISDTWKDGEYNHLLSSLIRVREYKNGRGGK